MFNKYNTEDKFFKKINTIRYKRNFLLIFFLISLLYILSLLIFNPYNNDLSFHIYRLNSIATNMQNGIWLSAPQADNICGWGYQLTVFYPSAFMYPFAFLTAFFNLNPQISFIIMIFTLNFISCILSYIAMYKIQKDKRTAFYFAILCGLNPIKIFNLIFYGFAGSFFASCFLPVAILGVYDLFKNNKYKMLIFGMTCLLYNHLITFLLMVIFIIIYSIFNIKNILNKKSIILNLFKAGLISFILSLGFLVPFIYYYFSDTFKFSFNKTQKDIETIISFNINPIIAFIFQIFLILGLYLFNKILKNKFKNNILSNSICITIWGLIALTDLFPWNLIQNIPFIGNIQMSFRIMEIIFIFIIFIFLDMILAIKDWNIVIVSLLISIIFLSTTIMTFSSNNFYLENPAYVYNNYENKKENTFFDIIAGEYLPLEFSINNKDINKINIDDLINEKPIFSNNTQYKISRNNLKTTLILKTNNKTDVILPIVYYKGYRAFLNKKEVKIEELDGKISIKNISSGTLIIEYRIQWFEYFSAFISISFLILILIKQLLKYKRRD